MAKKFIQDLVNKDFTVNAGSDSRNFKNQVT